MKRLSVLLLVFVAGACGGAGMHSATLTGADVLRVVPADTPYVFASLEPAPREHLDRWLKLNKPRLRKLTGTLPADLTPGLKLVATFLRELEPYYSVAGLEQLGLGRPGAVAVYGIGVLPAMRAEATAPDKLRGFIERTIARSGVKVPVRKSGGHSYWEFRTGTASIVWAVDGRWLVVTVAPTSLLGEVLPSLFADRLPERSLQHTRALADVARRYGLSQTQVGFVDLTRLLATFIDPKREQDRRALRGFGAQLDRIEGVCATELSSLTAEAPRLVLGVEALGARWARYRMTLDLSEKTARLLGSLRSPAAGVGHPLGNAVIRVGAAFDLRRAVDVVKLWGFAVRTRPFRCQALSSLNELAGEMVRELDGPLPTWLEPLRGISVVAFDLDFSRLRGYGLVTAADPLQVVGTLTAVIPQLGSVTIPPDGNPVATPTGLAPIDHVAVRGNVLGLSAGQGMDQELRRALAAPVAESAPLFQLALDGDAVRSALAMFGETLATLSGRWDFRLSVDDRGLTLRIEEQF